MPTTLNRALLGVLIPGTIAVAPWLLAGAQHTDATLGFDRYPSLAHVMLFAIVATIGTVIQGIASFFEDRWDGEREDVYSVRENWYAYLSRSLSPEPVGYRYLARLATVLQFELSMILAAPSFVFGSGVLTALRFPEVVSVAVCVAALGGCLASRYFWWQARCTHDVLCKVRRELNQRLSSSTTFEQGQLSTGATTVSGSKPSC